MVPDSSAWDDFRSRPHVRFRSLNKEGWKRGHEPLPERPEGCFAQCSLVLFPAQSLGVRWPRGQANRDVRASRLCCRHYAVAVCAIQALVL